VIARKRTDRADEESLVGKVRRELARGTVELAILAVLAPAPRYGYELITWLNGLTGGSPEIKEGTLYPVLHRLEDAGFITSFWQAEGRSSPRKYYSLTASGEDQLSLLRSEWTRLVDGIGKLLAREGRKK